MGRLIFKGIVEDIRYEQYSYDEIGQFLRDFTYLIDVPSLSSKNLSVSVKKESEKVVHYIAELQSGKKFIKILAKFVN